MLLFLVSRYRRLLQLPPRNAWLPLSTHTLSCLWQQKEPGIQPRLTKTLSPPSPSNTKGVTTKNPAVSPLTSAKPIPPDRSFGGDLGPTKISLAWSNFPLSIIGRNSYFFASSAVWGSAPALIGSLTRVFRLSSTKSFFQKYLLICQLPNPAVAQTMPPKTITPAVFTVLVASAAAGSAPTTTKPRETNRVARRSLASLKNSVRFCLRVKFSLGLDRRVRAFTASPPRNTRSVRPLQQPASLVDHVVLRRWAVRRRPVRGRQGSYGRVVRRRTVIVVVAYYISSLLYIINYIIIFYYLLLLFYNIYFIIIRRIDIIIYIIIKYNILLFFLLFIIIFNKYHFITHIFFKHSVEY